MYIIKVKYGRNLRGFRQSPQRLRHEMMNLNRPLIYTSSGGWTPEADMYETAHEMIVIVNLAGVRREDIEVSFNEHWLFVKGKRFEPASTGTPARYHQLEMGYGEFERFFPIPVVIDRNRADASYEDGRLTVVMKKAERPVRVRVEVSPR